MEILEARASGIPLVTISMSVTMKMANGDLVLDSAGRVVVIDGLEKAAQDMAESYLNNYDPEDPPYHNGCELYKLDDQTTTLDSFGIPSVIEAMIHDATVRLMDLQAQDPTITDEELIAEILFIRVWQVGLLSWAFYARCQTNSNEKANVSFTIDLLNQLPDGVAQLGDSFPGTGTPI